MVSGWNARFDLSCVHQPLRSVSWADITTDRQRDSYDPPDRYMPFNEAPAINNVMLFPQAGCKGEALVKDTNCGAGVEDLATFGIHRVASFALRNSVLAVSKELVGRPTEATCMGASNATEDQERQRAAVAFPGSVVFHDVAEIGGNSATMALNTSQRCYNVDLPKDFDAASISWSGLPQWSTLNADKIARLITFTEEDCTGNRTFYDVSQDFQVGKIPAVNSLMLEQYSPFPVGKPIRASVAVNLTRVPVPPFHGSMTFMLYNQRTFVGSREYPVDKVDTCYNVACVGARARWVTWRGLPTTGRIFTNGTMIAFYKDADCRGQMAYVAVNASSGMFGRENYDFSRTHLLSFAVFANGHVSSEATVDDECSLRHPSDPPARPLLSGNNTKDAISSWAWLSIGAVTGIAVLVIAVIIVNRYRQSSVMSSEHFEALLTDDALRDLRIASGEIQLAEAIDTSRCVTLYAATLQSHAILVKMLPHKFAKNAAIRDAFVSEAKTVAHLDHAKIVRFQGIYWTPCGDIGMVFERWESCSLRSLLQTHGRSLSWISTSRRETARGGQPTKRRIVMDIAEALMLLHSFDPPITHGQLSTNNVLVTASGVAKLWNIQSQVRDAAAWWYDRTATESLEKADIYAFGLLLLELDRCEPVSWLPLDDSVATIPPFTPACPPPVVQLGRHCLRHKAADRPNALQVFYELQRMKVR